MTGLLYFFFLLNKEDRQCLFVCLSPFNFVLRSTNITNIMKKNQFVNSSFIYTCQTHNLTISNKLVRTQRNEHLINERELKIQSFYLNHSLITHNLLNSKKLWYNTIILSWSFIYSPIFWNYSQGCGKQSQRIENQQIETRNVLALEDDFALGKILQLGMSHALHSQQKYMLQIKLLFKSLPF